MVERDGRERWWSRAAVERSALVRLWRQGDKRVALCDKLPREFLLLESRILYDPASLLVQLQDRVKDCLKLPLITL
jgi:hypothetical protein